jgi:pimeloyl-ACP methyl ester carboxylesterase
MQEEQLPDFTHSQPTLLQKPEFEFKLLRQLGLSVYGGATFGECYSVAVTMREWDPEGWTNSWAELAARVEERGQASLDAGHRISARESFLRATNYYHASEYYALISNGAHAHFGKKCQECFTAAMPLLDHHSEAVSVEANHDSYPCYFFAPDASGKKRKTVMLVPGIESCGEEQYFYSAISALARGYNVFVFQGPGQTGLLRNAPHCYLRHDYEVPLQVALDYLHGRDDVDIEHLTVFGSGLGSYFASRLAIYDHRVTALVVNPPFINLYRTFLALIGQRATKIDFTVSDIHELPESIIRMDMKLFVLNMCRRFGVERLQQLIHATQQFTIEEVLYRVTCPTLVIHGEATYPELENQALQFYEKIRSTNKHHENIPSIHIADAHDHVGNLALLNQTVFDWLDELP